MRIKEKLQHWLIDEDFIRDHYLLRIDEYIKFEVRRIMESDAGLEGIANMVRKEVKKQAKRGK